MRGPERFEQLIAFIDSHLAQPVRQDTSADGSVTFVSGDPAEVVVRLTRTSIFVFEYSASWEEPHALTPRPRQVGTVNWRRLPEHAVMTAALALMKGAREVRLERYRVCQTCGERTPPEAIYEDDICLACAEQQMGMVH